MYHQHTPSKHGRTVVIFIKKISAQIRAFWAFGLNHLEASFCQRKARPGQVLGVWLPESEGSLRFDADRIELICRPALDLGPKSLFTGTKKPVEVAIIKLEALVPLLLSRRASKIVIINLSQMSSNPEQRGVLLDPEVRKAHQRVFREVLVRLHKLGPEMGLEIVLFEQKDLLSNKNSALFERLFMSKCKS